MNLLLDTHVLIWWLSDFENLSKAAIEAIEDLDNICYISAASIWEMSIKRKIGKLKLPNSFYEVLFEQNFEELPISFSHSKNIYSLPGIHKDPFDRMLISQANIENLMIVSKDKIFGQYPVKLLAA